MAKKYIDVELLKAEIEALKRRKGFLQLGNAEITEAYMARGVQFTCDDIVNLIQSLQQEQPDKEIVEEKEFNEVYHKWFREVYLKEFPDLIDAAQYFYELGKSRKEDNAYNKEIPKWRRILKGEHLPCYAYLWSTTFENKASVWEGRLIPNVRGCGVGSDTWYLPVDDIVNLPKE